MSQDPEYFVFNVKDHNKGRDGSILWYKPEAMGHTDNLQDAGVYAMDEWAKFGVKPCIWLQFVSQGDALRAAKHISLVDIAKLPTGKKL